ncbi:hypothetical protein ACH5WX_11345, partial [Nocardioides sp. CER28]
MTLDSFEQSLLTDLREHVASRGTASARHTGRTRRTRRTRRRWALAAVPAGVAASVAVALSLGGSPSAYAVGTTAGGDVVVTIHRLDDAAGLEHALRAHGIRADVRYDTT